MKSNKLTAMLAAGLFLSLCVNFFFAGRMLGDAVHTEVVPVATVTADAPPDRDSRRDEWKKREEALHAALSEEDRTIMLAAKAEHDAIFESMREKLDAARSGVGEAMEADPFDQAVLDAAIAAEGAVKAQLLREMSAARRGVMERLSPEGRETLREMMPMRRGGKDKRPKEGRPPHDAKFHPPHAGDDVPGRPVPGHPAPEPATAPEDMPNDAEAPGFAPPGEDLQPPDAPPVSAP